MSAAGIAVLRMVGKLRITKFKLTVKKERENDERGDVGVRQGFGTSVQRSQA